MRVRGLVLFTVVPVTMAMLAGCGKTEPPKPAAPPPTPPAAVEGKALFEQKCGVCHDLARATARQETREKWAEVVKSMQGKKADWISDQDAAKIVEFLATEHGKK